MLLSELFDHFLKERRYLKNITIKTENYYRNSWDSFCRFITAESPANLSRDQLTDYIICLRESGVKPVTCNTYISGLNAFFAWLYEQGYVVERLSMKKLKLEQQVVKTLDEDSVLAILLYKPKSHSQRRAHAVICLLVDTGLRIEEALTIKPGAIDMDNLLIKVMGKGQKERLVPFSYELRRVLQRYFNSAPSIRFAQYAYCTTEGGKLNYWNLDRDYAVMCSKCKIQKQGSFHRLRHTFATNYVRNGGNVLYLSRVLGHTTLQMTKKYVGMDTEVLQEMQMRTSLLQRLR